LKIVFLTLYFFVIVQSKRKFTDLGTFMIVISLKILAFQELVVFNTIIMMICFTLKM